ncbi:MAG: O-antigen ligase family protein [Candidatus Magasanikbacteria bacterium]|nr:O-antigen ligase family protein [Candidatus Magasanikbacteria bacterium]
MIKLSKIINFLILAFLFLLPWQTRWIYFSAKLNGLPWEYGTLSYYGTEILLWLIVILTGIRIFGNSSFIKEIFTRVNLSRRWPAVILGIAIAFFAAYFYAVSPVREVSTQFISRLVGSICLMICLVASNLNFKQMGLAFWGGGAIQGIIAVGQFLTQEIFANKWLGLASHKATDIGAAVVQSADERWLRAYGSFGWPNSLGIYLAAVFIFGLILFTKIDKKYQPFFLGGQMIIVAGLLFSFSRGAWVAALAGLITCLFIAWARKIKPAISPALKQIMCGVFIVAVVVLIFLPLFNTRTGAVGYLEKLSLCERLAQYNIADTVITNNLWLGVGPGLYTYYLAAHFPILSYGTYQPVHNIYFLAVAELGVLMFLCFAALVIWFIVKTWETRPIYIGVISVLLVAGLFDHFLWSLYAGQVLFWAIFGLGLAKEESTDGSPTKGT